VDLPAGAHGLGQHHAGRVGGLEESLQVDPPGDLPDQHRGHALGPQLLVHTEVVDLHHLLHPANVGGEKREI